MLAPLESPQSVMVDEHDGGSTTSDGDASPVERVETSVLPKTQPSRRERRRDSERRSREKRKTNLDSMRASLEVLECAAANVALAVYEPWVDDDDELLASVILNEEERQARRMRMFMRRSMALGSEARKLESVKSELRRMLREYEMTARMLRLMTKGMEVDEWTQQCERWRALTLATFTPWTQEACWKVIDESMKKISQFNFLDEAPETTGLDFMGWRDRRRFDPNTNTIHFSFTKVYRHMDAEMMSQGYWEMHLDGKKYHRCMLGPNVNFFYEVVQNVSPDICIVRCVEQYPTMPIKIHMLFLTFRVRMKDGFVQGVRTIPCPELLLATDDEDAYWTNNFHWVRWDIKRRGANGECVEVESSVNGSMASSAAEYGNRWMGEAILTLVRAESALLGRQFLKF